VNDSTGKSNLNLNICIDLNKTATRDIMYVVNALTSADNLQNKTISNVIFKHGSSLGSTFSCDSSLRGNVDILLNSY